MMIVMVIVVVIVMVTEASRPLYTARSRERSANEGRGRSVLTPNAGHSCAGHVRLCQHRSAAN